jgi:cytoskeletal protein CcmA (bactofilin family)
MPASKQDRILVPCPHCGHRQPESSAAISTYCKACGRHFEVRAAPPPARAAETPAPERRRITCFACGTELEVSPNAQSTMCKRCSAHIDLQSHHITGPVSKNFRTKGCLIIEPKGYLLNSEAHVGEAVIKGRFIGKLRVEGALTIHSSAEIKGTFNAGRLVIPAENHFYWKDPIRVRSAEIAGELAASLEAADTITLKSTARMFGDLTARHLIVEPGAVVVGEVRIGAAPDEDHGAKTAASRPASERPPG